VSTTRAGSSSLSQSVAVFQACLKHLQIVPHHIEAGTAVYT